MSDADRMRRILVELTLMAGVLPNASIVDWLRARRPVLPDAEWERWRRILHRALTDEHRPAGAVSADQVAALVSAIDDRVAREGATALAAALGASGQVSVAIADDAGTAYGEPTGATRGWGQLGASGQVPFAVAVPPAARTLTLTWGGGTSSCDAVGS